MIKIAPSILSADFANLESEIKKIRGAGADYAHIDVMDGIFVPNITIGIPVVAALRKVTDMPLDVHLMIDRPIRYVPHFIKAGSDIVTIHVESDTEENTSHALRMIRESGVKAGLTLKPGTPPEAVYEFLELCDLILVMTVEPGFGGQSFMHSQLDKINAFRKIIDVRSPGIELEVDGGINPETARLCTEAGANVLVAGNSVFSAEDMPGRIMELRQRTNDKG